MICKVFCVNNISSTLTNVKRSQVFSMMCECCSFFRMSIRSWMYDIMSVCIAGVNSPKAVSSRGPRGLKSFKLDPVFAELYILLDL